MAQKGLTPVTYERHGHRYWRRFTSYEFARQLTECSVVEAEILQVAAMFPIAFRVTAEGCQPVALLSMKVDTTTPFVAVNGTWLARYVPTALRCPPFYAGPVTAPSSPKGHQFRLLVDEAMGLVTDDPDDVRFFDEGEGLTQELVKVKLFLFHRAAAELETQALCRLICDMNILSPLGEVLKMDCPADLFGVQSQAIDELGPNQRTLLVNSKAMRLIHAHQVSMMHAQWLEQLQHQLADRPENPTSPEVKGFLDAVVDAQCDDLPLIHNWQEGVHAYV